MNVGFKERHRLSSVFLPTHRRASVAGAGCQCAATPHPLCAARSGSRTSPPARGEQRDGPGADQAGPGAPSEREEFTKRNQLLGGKLEPDSGSQPPFREAPPCRPLGAPRGSVREPSPPAAAAYPDLILLLLGRLLLSPLPHILEAEKAALPRGPSQRSPPPSPPLPSPTSAVLLLLA